MERGQPAHRTCEIDLEYTRQLDIELRAKKAAREAAPKIVPLPEGFFLFRLPIRLFNWLMSRD